MDDTKKAANTKLFFCEGVHAGQNPWIFCVWDGVNSMKLKCITQHDIYIYVVLYNQLKTILSLIVWWMTTKKAANTTAQNLHMQSALGGAHTEP